MATILSPKQITKKINAIKGRAGTLRDMVQVTLASIAGHAYAHGDVSAYDALFEAASGLNRHEMSKWIGEFGFAKLDAESGKFKVIKAARKNAAFSDAQDVFTHLMENERKWYEQEKDAAQVAKDLDIAKRISGLARTITNAPEKGRKLIADDKAIQEAIKDLHAAVVVAMAEAEAEQEAA